MRRGNTPNLVRYLRNRLVRRGLIPHRHTLSVRVLGASRGDVTSTDPPHGTPAGSDAWPIHAALEALEAGEPLGFAHYNDGEARCLLEGRHRTRDGVTVCDPATRSLLSGSLRRLVESEDPRVRERFLVGLPCPRCHGAKAADLLTGFGGLQASTRVPATLFHHAVGWSRTRVMAALARRPGPLHLVCSTQHDVAAVEALLGRTFDGVLRVERTGAHLEPELFDPWIRDTGWGARGPDGPPPTLLLLCGMMGRPWAVDAFLADPDSVTLCLGSYLDDVALNRILPYVDGTEVSCPRCLRPRRAGA